MTDGGVMDDGLDHELGEALADRRLLRWLHAEAAFERDRLQTALEECACEVDQARMDGYDQGTADGRRDSATQVRDLQDAYGAAESSRRDWAAEALKWREYSGMAWDQNIDWLVAFGQEHHDFPRVCACISDTQADALGPGFSRPVCAVHPEKALHGRVFPVGSPEPADVLAVRSAVNHVVFQHWPNWGKWRAMESSGGDGEFYAWRVLNSGPDGAEMAEVRECVPGTPWAEGGER